MEHRLSRTHGFDLLPWLPGINPQEEFMHRHFLLFWLSALCACATTQPTPSPQPDTSTPNTTPPAAAVLAAPEVAGINVLDMDRKANPCEDFFVYACGSWMARNQIPADKPRWGRFNEIEEHNQEKLRDILQAAADGKIDKEDLYGQKLGDFYATCLDEAGIEKNGLADLISEWAKLDAVKDSATLATAVGRLHSTGVFALFYFGSMQDMKDSTQVIAAIFQGGLSLPDIDYYLKDDAKSAEIRKNFISHMEKMFALAGQKPVQAKEQAKVVFDLEKALAESYWTRTEMRDPEKIYHPVDAAGLQKLTPQFPWKHYLAALELPQQNAFSFSTPKAMIRLAELTKKMPASTWRAYLRWHVLADMAEARALPKAFVDESFAFAAKNFTGAQENKLRWKHCVEATDQLLGEALGQAFVRRWFGGDTRDKAQTLIQDVQLAQKTNISTLVWMDPTTQQKAQEKLRAINNKVGYPSKWRDYSSVEVSRSSYLKNLLATSGFEIRRDLNKIGKPVDRSEWSMSPPTVNAYYDGQLNEMVFPAGILQPVFYTRGANDAVNYGAIGMVVAHELTHGFDDQGRKFDGKGNMTDWWSPPVSQEFEKRSLCLDKQYADYVAVDDLKLNGKLTLGENIADLGGVKLALAAYRASRDGKPAEAQVEGFSPEQQFFLAAAQAWCFKVRPEEARKRVRTDPHSPPNWRVNGTLSNLPDFAKAFQCKAGDPMVKTDRCEVW